MSGSDPQDLRLTQQEDAIGKRLGGLLGDLAEGSDFLNDPKGSQAGMAQADIYAEVWSAADKELKWDAIEQKAERSGTYPPMADDEKELLLRVAKLKSNIRHEEVVVLDQAFLQSATDPKLLINTGIQPIERQNRLEEARELNPEATIESVTG